jgi:hypothetical protein
MENTAKNFALQLGSLISLYVTLGALINILFAVINIIYPDVINGYGEYESASYSIRLSIALLIVFFPAYIMLTRFVNVARRSQETAYLGLTKWLIYLSLLVGGAVMLGDVVTVINNFLNGELTIRFILKALVVLVVVGVAFIYYFFDARTYWQTHEAQSKQYGMGAAVIVVASLILGFMNTETPSEVREMRIDQTQVNDLQTIQYRIEESYHTNGKLPLDINTLYEGLESPQAPEGRMEYTYTVTSGKTFELCADFVNPSSKSEQMRYSEPMYMDKAMISPSTWDHAAGTWCFKRTVNAPVTISPIIDIAP